MLNEPQGRAGLLSCACDIFPPDETTQGRGPPRLALLTTAFSFSIVAQVLAFAVLPLAGATLAPSPAAATVPLILMLVGAAAASFPASFLPGQFGRRAAFALGASLGIAGAAIGAWGIATGQFAGLCLGAFWLGTAQGFGLFYRHTASSGAPSGGRAIATVMGGASLAAVAAPVIVQTAQRLAGPLAPAAALAGAGLMLLGALVAAAGLPGRIEVAGEAPVWSASARDFAAISGAAALAWAGMSFLMASAPLLMEGCGLGFGASSSAISWHVLAMWAPTAVIGAGGWRLPAVPAVLGGLALVLLGCAVVHFQASAPGFDISLIIGGCGWSLATLGSTLWVHGQGVPPRLLLALHDLGLFAGAIGGALAAGALV